MAVTIPRKYMGMYCGNIEYEQAKLILGCRQAKKIANLKRMVYNFDRDLVEQAIDEGRSVRSIARERGMRTEECLGELRDYQTSMVGFLYLSKRSITGDGVGLGKTVEISGLLNYIDYMGEMTRFIMAVESTALLQTQVEIMKFTGMCVVTLPSDAVKMKRAIKKIDWENVNGVIIQHSALKSSELSSWLSLSLDENGKSKLFNTFILDESSIVKNPIRKTYEYTKNLCDIVDRVHFMNATTFETNIMDIYHQVDVMDSSILPAKYRIEERYCEFNKRTFWKKGRDGKAMQVNSRKRCGYKNEREFKESLKLMYYGRCKKDIGIDIPHIYKVYEIEPTKEQIKAIGQGYRYAEVLNSPENVVGLNMKMTRKDVPKLDRLCNLVENEFDGQQVMIYCWHVNAQEAIKRELEEVGRKVVILNGRDEIKTRDENRKQIMKDFNDGTYDVIITNIKKSLNLHGGDVCIMYSAISTPSAMEQVRGRIDRNTDDRTKTFIMLLYKDTDEYNLITQVTKQRSKDARNLTIDAETAIDYFMASMEESE